MIGLAGIGLGILVALATFIGVALDREARDAAWKRIASARRINSEQARDLEEREIAMDARHNELNSRERRLDERDRLLFEREALMDERE